MTKVAVYGFVRIIFDLIGAPAWWWSMPVLVLGGATAVMGVLYALMQHDLKRLLAYHTVENIGIVFIGLRLALAFKAHGMAVAAAIAMTAALLHVLNQALERTYNATPDPKWVVAIGDCALDGGVFAGSYAVVGGVSSVVPVDLHIRGCPPSPAAILSGLTALVTSTNRQKQV